MLLDGTAGGAVQKNIRRLLVPLMVGVFVSPVSAEDQRFHIKRYQIDGVTLLDQRVLEERVARFTGADKVFGDIQQALEALELAYKEKGYSGVQVLLPEQELTDGVVRMSVQEARIAKVEVSGNRFFDTESILALLPFLRTGQPPLVEKISANVQLANENPARQMDVSLRVSPHPGELDARVEVQDRSPWLSTLTSDNTGNRSTGRDRTGFAVQHANLWGNDHVGSLAYTTSLEKPDKTRIFSMSYRWPLYRLGDSVDLIYAYSSVNAGTTATVVGPLTFSGKGQIASARYNLIFPRRGDFSHRFVFGLDHRQFDNTCRLAGADICGPSGSDLTLRPASVAYTGTWSGPGRAGNFNLALSSNLSGGRNGKQQDFAIARRGAKPGYQLLRGNVQLMQALPQNWSLRAGLNAQWTDQPLVSSEQLGIAGTSAVRGFAERAIAGDRGAVINLELHSPNLLPEPIAGEHSLKALTFFDTARSDFSGEPPGTYDTARLASAGIGMRFTLGRDTEVRLDTARVLKAPVEAGEERGDWRTHLGVRMGF